MDSPTRNLTGGGGGGNRAARFCACHKHGQMREIDEKSRGLLIRPPSKCQGFITELRREAGESGLRALNFPCTKRSDRSCIFTDKGMCKTEGE